jgi:hypothetical protein
VKTNNVILVILKVKNTNKINKVIKIILLKKELVAQAKDTEVLNKEICEDFKYVDGKNI